MENNKDIGKLFRDKIDQLDKSPNENGWFAIQSELDKKEKRRVLPFWFWYAGILSLGILLTTLVYKNFNQQEPILKNIEKTNISKKNNTEINKNSNREILGIKNEVEANESLNENSNANSELVINNKEKNENHNIRKSESVEKINSNYSNKKSKKITNKYSVVNTKNSLKTFGNKLFKNKKSKQIKTSKIINFTNSDKENNSESDLKQENLTNKSSDDLINETILKEEKKIVSNSDTTQSKAKKQIETLKSKKAIPVVAEKDSIMKEEENDKMVTVFIYGTPTTTGVFGTKSSLDNRLEKASTFSEITLGYGAYLCYQGSEKLSIRIGVAKSNLKFVTKNATINTFNYDNISYENGISNQSIFNQSNDSQLMTIYQDASYFEIPIEIKYKFLDKKIGLNAIFGIKQLFLDKNEVYAVTSNGYKTKIGQTSNLLKQTFGANLGLGLDYKISKRIKFNLETMFQYNIKNTNNSEGSKPFSVGVLTGLEFNLFGKQ